MIHIKFSLIYV